MRSYFALLGCSFWICLLGSCQGFRYVVERGNLEVITPESLQGFYDSSVGRFGIPEHGGALAGRVVYPEDNQRACTSFRESYTSGVGSLPVIFLIDRGDCFFTTKVFHAHRAAAVAVLIVDDSIEPLITMETSEVPIGSDDFLEEVDIPSALISKSIGDKIKEALFRGELVSINLVFNSPNEVALPPHEQVKYDWWINANLGCGPKCQEQLEFVQNFGEVAKVFEERGYAQFTPHFVTWYCTDAFVLSPRCKSQCINHGRYCTPDPREETFDRGCNKESGGMIRTGCYGGRDIVIQSLVQACFHKVARESGKPWLWWDYVNNFASQCSMKNGMYGMPSCRDRIIRRLGLDINKIYECVGDTEADQEHPLLKAEQEAQIGGLGRGKDVTVVPSLVINGNYYRGKLVKEDVLKAVCADIKGELKPDICPKVIPEEGLQEILAGDFYEATQAIPYTASLERVNREVDFESRKEGEEMEARPAGDIPRAWSWEHSRSSGRPGMEDMTECNEVEIHDQDESGLPARIVEKEAIRIISNTDCFEKGDLEKGSNPVSSESRGYKPLGYQRPSEVLKTGQRRVLSGKTAKEGK